MNSEWPTLPTLNMDLSEIAAEAFACGWSVDEVEGLQTWSEDLGFVRYFDVTPTGISAEGITFAEPLHRQIALRAHVASQLVDEAEDRHGIYWFHALLTSPLRGALIEAARKIDGAIYVLQSTFLSLPDAKRVLVPVDSVAIWEPWFDQARGKWLIRPKQ